MRQVERPDYVGGDAADDPGRRRNAGCRPVELARDETHDFQLLQNTGADLAPLAGMPLTSLNLLDCPRLHDLAPLAGMSLSEIQLTPKNFTKDRLEVVRQCKSLKTLVIGRKSTDLLAAPDFWKQFDAGEFKP